jgi:hypothetical protein
MTIILSVIDMMNIQFTNMGFFTAQLAATFVALAYTLLETFREPNIVGLNPIVHHGKLLRTLGRTKSFPSVKWCLVSRTASLALSVYIISLCKTLAAVRTVDTTNAPVVPKTFTAMLTSNVLLTRLNGAIVGTKSLVRFTWPHLKRFTAILTSKRYSLFLSKGFAFTRAKTAVATSQVKAVGLKPYTALVTGVKNWWLTSLGSRAGTGAKFLRFVLGAKDVATLRAYFGGHSISCHTKPDNKKWGGWSGFQLRQWGATPFKPYPIIAH